MDTKPSPATLAPPESFRERAPHHRRRRPINGPEPVAQILDRIIWKLLVQRETQRAKERP
jgi:hypothetical protein